jgi:hypothetical protein
LARAGETPHGNSGNRNTAKGELVVASQVIRTGISSFVAGCGALMVAHSLARADAPEQYPYDPACAWGRLADGHGMLLRCLQPGEATQLLSAEIKQGPAKPPEGKTSEAARGGATAPGASPGTPKLAVTQVGPAQADAGELPLAEKKLTAVNDRYVACVEANGGLTAESGRVVLRFLVRERGRAEGVTVKSVSGMSDQAARCIANVVDRRFVGYPAAPIVGATLPISVGARR